MKKLPSLHVLNGDATVPVFESASLPGQHIVWREILSEGPALATLPESEFWHKRQEYITSTYEDTPLNYKQKVLDELVKLQESNAFFEVTLWFDADLMCQINLLYLLQLLSNRGPAIISVCTPSADRFIANLTPTQLKQLFDKRVQLSENQLDQAVELWQLYGSPDSFQLQKYLEQNSILLPNLAEALKLYMQRFPSCQTGLGQPEQQVLELIADGVKSKEQLVQEFCSRNAGLGFGDRQILNILERLQPDLVQGGEPLHLSFFGERVLDGIASFIPKTHWLGGALIEPTNYSCYDTNTGRLIKKVAKK